MKRMINTKHLGEFIHDLVAVPKSAKFVVQIGKTRYCGEAQIEDEPENNCITLHFPVKKRAPAKKAKKGGKK